MTHKHKPKAKQLGQLSGRAARDQDAVVDDSSRADRGAGGQASDVSASSAHSPCVIWTLNQMSPPLPLTS